MKILVQYSKTLLPALLVLVISGLAHSAWAVTPQVRSGVDHTVQLRSDGTIWTTGSNWTGQLGDGTTIGRTAPVQVGLLSNTTNWVAVATGDDHTLALKSDGSLWSWGANQDGQLGDGSTVYKTHPVRIGGGNDWTSVAAGGTSSFALKANGELWAWGGNATGQLGDNSIVNRNSPVRIGTGTNWKAVAAGEFHTLALKADGTLWAWGNNIKGQLGNGTTTASSNPVRIGTTSDWTAAAAGGSSSFAMKVDGSLWAWGLNDYGQLGIGVTDGAAHSTPVKVTPERDWAAISAGNLHVLAIKRNGTLWAWGDNTSGQLGDGTRTNRNTPTRIASPAAIADIVAVAAGAFHSVSLKANGELYAWGDNGSGQLGNGGDVGSSSALHVGTDEIGWVATEPGGEFTVARRSNGTIWAWGDNNKGQLGNNTLTAHSAPAMIGEATNWVAQTAGWSHAVALQADGSLWTWGNNSKGQLGNGTTANLKIPTRITTANDWAAVSAGDFHTLALKTDGTLWAWGDNAKGQLGDNSTTGRLAPTQIITGNPGNFDKRWVAISAGGSHSLALHADGTLWAWGNNGSGQLGDSNLPLTNVNKPHQVADLTPPVIGWNSSWVAIAAGLNHSLALQADGTLWAWGNNFSGQLGNGDTTLPHPPARSAPVMVLNPSGIPYVSITAGDSYSAARRADGTLWSWGNNTSGQLGTGPHPTDVDPLLPQPHPTPVQELSHANDWVDAGSGGGHTVAPKASGSLWAWGNNTKGELGDNSASTRNIPSPLAEGQIDVASTVAFNAVAIGTVPIQTITIRNTGTGPLTITGMPPLGVTDFSVTPETCGQVPFTVKTGGNCTLVAAFNPALPAGPKSATLTINSSDPLSQIITVGLSGTAVVPFSVVTSVTPAGSGTITPSGTNGTVLVVPGSGQLFSITPTTGYRVVDVTLNGVSKGAVQSLALPPVTANETISATFAVNNYFVTSTPGPNGAISGLPAMARHGDMPTCTITPNPGYHVVDVTVNGKSAGAVTSLKLPALLGDTEVAATFAINSYTITMNAGANGAITGPATVNHGDTPAYAITSNTGYSVTDVTVNGVSKGAVTALTLPPVTANATIAATFGGSVYTITAESDARGTMSPSGKVTVTHGSNKQFVFTPVPGYTVVNVIVDGVSQGPHPTYTFTNVTSDGHTLKAVFIPDGDLNNDGRVDVADAIRALKIAVGLIAPTATDMLRGDSAPVGKDGIPVPDSRIKVDDALLILKKVVGLTSGW